MTRKQQYRQNRTVAAACLPIQLDKKPFAWGVLPLHYVLKLVGRVVSIHSPLRTRFTVSLLEPPAFRPLKLCARVGFEPTLPSFWDGRNTIILSERIESLRNEQHQTYSYKCLLGRLIPLETPLLSHPKLVAGSRFELLWDAYETPIWTTRLTRDWKFGGSP